MTAPEQRIDIDGVTRHFRAFGEPNHHFSAEDDRGVLIVGVVYALVFFAAGLAVGWAWL